MKRIILVLSLLLILSPVFASQAVTLNIGDYPMRSLCEQLQGFSFDFEGEIFEGTGYEDLNEFPPELIDYINARFTTSETTTEALDRIGGITFSAEINYNGSSCFAGSFMFNNSQLQYFKLEPDELAGQDTDHLLFHIELINIENIIMEWMSIQAGESIDFIQIIFLFFRTVWTILTSVIGNDIFIRPITGLMNLIDGITVFIQLPDFSGADTEIAQQLMQRIGQ